MLAILVASCSSDAAVCLYLPCPLPEAATIAVTGSNAPTGVAGLTMTVSGAVSEGDSCPQAPDGTSVCQIYGGLGTYHVVLNAPGYRSATLDFTATGVPAGCNTCGHVDLQHLSVVLQPTS